MKRETCTRNNATVCCRISSCRSFKPPCNKAAASESPRRTAEYVEGLSDARTQLWGGFKLLLSAEVVKWQTRTFEGRVAQAVRVQVPPSAPTEPVIRFSPLQHSLIAPHAEKTLRGPHGSSASRPSASDGPETHLHLDFVRPSIGHWHPSKRLCRTNRVGRAPCGSCNPIRTRHRYCRCGSQPFPVDLHVASIGTCSRARTIPALLTLSKGSRVLDFAVFSHTQPSRVVIACCKESHHE